MLDKTPEDKPKDDFFDHIAIDIFSICSRYHFYPNNSSNYTPRVLTFKIENLTNRNCFSASKSSRSSGNQTSK